jgi:acetolactate synthase-1/2/3 large subunit
MPRGVGTPYAVAASLAYPGRQVVCVTGDGAFGINGMEIDTAVRHAAKIVVIVSNNAAWNIERLDQETNYGGRVVGTLLAHSDYAAMARAFGAHGERVEKPEDLPGAIERALANARLWSMWRRRRQSCPRTRRRGWAPSRSSRP